MQVLVAPDSFKGTMDAATVASALAAALGGRHIEVPVTGPVGDPVSGSFLLTDDGRLAVLDTATASGLGLVPERRRDAEAASTAGTGELLLAAVDSGAERILLGVGGSATTDGGAGALGVLAACAGPGSRCCATSGRRSRTRQWSTGRRRAQTRRPWNA